MVYFAVGSLGLEGGIMVTASHNPKEYTGMKIVRRGALPVGGESGLLDVRDRAVSDTGYQTAESRQVRERTTSGPNTSIGCCPSWTSPRSGRCKVVIDAANGMAGTMLPPVLERLPIDAVRCYFEPDGSFPNHEPNPLLPENREFIVRKTLEEGADLGVAFDGDADRCFFVDDTGEFVPGDFVTALFAEIFLAREPGAKIIYDVRASHAVPGHDRARRRRRRSSTASATPSSRRGCARRTPSSPARCPATTTSATSARPTPASSRSCSCSS